MVEKYNIFCTKIPLTTISIIICANQEMTIILDTVWQSWFIPEELNFILTN